MPDAIEQRIEEFEQWWREEKGAKLREFDKVMLREFATFRQVKAQRNRKWREIQERMNRKR